MLVPDDNIMADDHTFSTVAMWYNESVDVLQRVGNSYLIRRPSGITITVSQRELSGIRHTSR